MFDAIWHKISKRKEEEVSIETILKNSPVFDGLKTSEISFVSKMVYLRKYSRDEIIFYEGQPGVGLYIIKNGRVRIRRYSDGIENTLSVLTAGDFFGELSLFDESPRSADAISETDNTEIICFFKPELLQILDKKAKVGAKILFNCIKIISERLRLANEKLKELSDKPKI